MWTRGFLPFDEGSADAFHGRAEEIARLARLCSGEARVVALSGVSGVGKTSLGQSIARALGRKFERLSLGGLHDEAELRGTLRALKLPAGSDPNVRLEDLAA